MVMIRILFFSILFIICSNCDAQKIIVKFERPSFAQVDSIITAQKCEVRQFDYQITVSKDYFPGADTLKLGKPIVFSKNLDSLSFEQSIFFSLPDSLIRLSDYTWNANQRTLKQLKQQFEINKKFVSEYFGKAGISVVKQPGPGDENYFSESVTWQNEYAYVNVYFIAGMGTYRTRVIVSWRKRI